jgi:hypothetical protein
MDREQAQLLKDGSSIVARYLKGDHVAGTMVATLGTSGNPDSLLIVALVAEESWAVHTGAELDEMWGELPEPSPIFATETIDRQLVVAKAKQLRDGIHSDFDEGAGDLEVVLLSALDLALAAVEFLAEASEVSASAWCHNWGIAAGAALNSDGHGDE